MANAVVRPIINAYPYSNASDDRNSIYNGILQIEPGNYPAGGIPLLFPGFAVSAPAGGAFNLSTPNWLPTDVAVHGQSNGYGYSIGGLVSVINGLPVFCSNVALTSNVCTVTATNAFVTGQVVNLNGFTGATFLNGQQVTVLSTGLSAAQFEFNFTNANYSSTADVGLALPYPASTPPALFLATNVALTSNVVTITANNNFVMGETVTCLLFQINTFLNQQTLTVASATATSFTAAFTHANVTSVADSGTIYPQITFLHIFPGNGVTNAASTASAFSITSNVVTMTATNTFVAGEQVLLQGFTTATYLNGFEVTILSAGLSGSQYEFNFVHANTSGSDTGTATRTDIIAGAAIPGAVLSDQIFFRAVFSKG